MAWRLEVVKKTSDTFRSSPFKSASIVPIATGALSSIPTDSGLPLSPLHSSPASDSRSCPASPIDVATSGHPLLANFLCRFVPHLSAISRCSDQEFVRFCLGDCPSIGREGSSLLPRRSSRWPRMHDSIGGRARRSSPDRSPPADPRTGRRLPRHLPHEGVPADHHRTARVRAHRDQPPHCRGCARGVRRELACISRLNT